MSFLTWARRRSASRAVTVSTCCQMRRVVSSSMPFAACSHAWFLRSAASWVSAGSRVRLYLQVMPICHAPESVACVWLVMVAVILYWLMMVSFPVSWIVCPAIPRFFFLAFRSSAALPAKAGSVQSIAPGAARLRGDLTGSATPV